MKSGLVAEHSGLTVHLLDGHLGVSHHHEPAGEKPASHLWFSVPGGGVGLLVAQF